MFSLKSIFRKRHSVVQFQASDSVNISQFGGKLGLVCGQGSYPLRFIRSAKKQNLKIFSICHHGETDQIVADESGAAQWIRVGELGTLIHFFKQHQVKHVAFAGGINRVRLFGGVKLDARGALLLARVRSTKDDKIMRALADEFAIEGITVVSCTLFFNDGIIPEGVLTKRAPTIDELEDIAVGRSVIQTVGEHDIGQLVCVREGVVVAVEAVEGSDRAIERGCTLGGNGTVIIKCAKPTQDMRFDVPTVGIKTFQMMKEFGGTVLALEAGRSLMLDREECLEFANQNGISVIGCPPLISLSSHHQ
jgi:UDP-2,3-diacylglucosamine hydrolase